MLLHIPELLSPPELAELQSLLAGADWHDGRVTAGLQSAQVKHNLQLPQEGEAARRAGAIVRAALDRNALFFSAALPAHIFPPLFNLYRGGMAFGDHVDNAVRTIPATGQRIRTDLSATLFLGDPDAYDGGELVIDDTYGTHSVKLPAGDMVLYPSTSLHRVTAVTRGARLASFFWLQSMVRDAGQRAILFDMDMALTRLRAECGDQDELVTLTGCYHNLLRLWAEL